MIRGLLKLLLAVGIMASVGGCRSSYAPAPAYYTAPAVAPTYYSAPAAAAPCCPCQCTPAGS
jgi:hypothetical protein